MLQHSWASSALTTIPQSPKKETTLFIQTSLTWKKSIVSSATRTTKKSYHISFPTCYIHVLASHTENDDTERVLLPPFPYSQSKRESVTRTCHIKSDFSVDWKKLVWVPNCIILLELLHGFFFKHPKCKGSWQIENYLQHLSQKNNNFLNILKALTK